MTTKLTLTIEDKVIHAAKQYAQKKGKSLSRIVENYLKSISMKETKNHTTLSPKITRLLGVINLPAGFDYKAALTHSLSKKYKK